MNDFSRLILHPDFENALRELGNKDIFLPNYGVESSFERLNFTTESGKITNIEEIKGYRLDAEKGCEEASRHVLTAYDESWLSFEALEGTAYFTTYSLVLAAEKDYLPLVLATFNFYTRSSAIKAKSAYIKHTDEDLDVAYRRDFQKDKIGFLLEHTPPNSLLFIDGPLISGDLYTIVLDANSEFLRKSIVPIFFVKDSNSNIVTSNILGVSGQYNSDMHWLNTVLSPGQRSNFFKYEDEYNAKNTKVFCYLKAFSSVPQRIEFHTDTFQAYQGSIEKILDLILYLMLVQGLKKNPQLRPIAIAEAYARAVLRFIDINKYFKEAQISPTLNQIRFGG